MLFLSLVYEKDRETEYMRTSRVAMQAADNVLQWNIVDGLLQAATPLDILNSVPVGNFPKSCKRVRFPEDRRSYGEATLCNIGFWNLPLIKPLCRYLAYRKCLRRVPEEDNRLLVYGLYLPQLLALKHAKRRANWDVCVVIDDLPAQFGILSGNRLKVWIKTLVGKWMLRILDDPGTVNRFVLLTEHMKEALDLAGRPYCVMEGIANASELEPAQAPAQKVVFYAGTLNRRFGIEMLLDAFALLPGEEYALWLCGGGNAQERVEAAAATDGRIRYYGFVPKVEADRLRNMATVLVNPRRNEGAYTRYSFPSKTIEYLLAAKPVVMYRLDGIPGEYDPWLCYVEGDTAEDMARAIKAACDTDLTQHSLRAREWVLANKTPGVQGKKILELYKE